MRVVCVGAGPGGLYAALLLKRRHPAWDVRVIEQNGPDETFGFGVVFSEPTLERLKEGDRATYEALLAISRRWDPIEVRLRHQSLLCKNQGFVGVGRHELLAYLRQEASELGVRLEYRVEVEPDALPDADLVIAADGARSRIRKRFADAFEPTIETGSSYFIWYGTTQRFDSLTFIFEQNVHGAFGAHVYPFSDGRSTFIIETDEAALQRAGLDFQNRDYDAERSIAYCEQLFSRHLGGHRLLSNRSRWATFRTVRCQRWRADRVVLLGDAAHTAHFSMGSGTKLALEDGLALAEAFSEHEGLDAALAAYEAVRRPEVRKIQQASRRSLAWWEQFRHQMNRDVEPFAFHFLTRNMRVTRASIARRDPELASRVEEWCSRYYLGDGAKGARGLPLTVRGRVLKHRVVHDGPRDGEPPALRLATAGPPPPPAASGDALAGVRVDADALDHVDASWDWLELSLPATESALSHARRARSAWSKPLSVRIEPRGRPTSDIVAFAGRLAQLGIDVVTLAWQGTTEPDLLSVAEAIRASSPILLLVDTREGIDPDTLVFSGRADLVLE